MLQQTGVKTVGPYFLKFLARWPDVAALSRASQDDVLRMWAGLGYYSRARNLHACAVAVLRDHGGGVSRYRGRPAHDCRGRSLHSRRHRARSPSISRDHAGRRQYRARGVAALRDTSSRCRRPSRAFRELAATSGASRARWRQRPGADGSRLLDLHAEEAGLRALSDQRGMPRRGHAAIRKRFRARRRRSRASCAAGPPSSSPVATNLLVRTRAREGPARWHDGSAGFDMAGRSGRPGER